MLYLADPQQPGLRPGIGGQTCLYLILIRSLEDMQGLLAASNGAAENDETIRHEPVHEGRMLGPAFLLTDLTRRVPTSAVDQPHRENSHARSVRAVADMPFSPGWLLVPATAHPLTPPTARVEFWNSLG